MIILCDTRETYPWKFDIYEGWYSKTEKIDAGDYVAVGHETSVVIERKASPSEIAVNLGQKSAVARFNREIVRAQKTFDKFIILCEFSLSDLYGYPKNLPDHVKAKLKEDGVKLRTTGAYLKKILDGLIEEYGITVIYAGSRDQAQDRAKAIFEKLEEEDLF